MFMTRKEIQAARGKVLLDYLCCAAANKMLFGGDPKTFQEFATMETAIREELLQRLAQHGGD